MYEYWVTVPRATLGTHASRMNINSLLRELSGPRPSRRVVDRANLGCWHPSTTDIHIPSLRDSHPVFALPVFSSLSSPPIIICHGSDVACFPEGHPQEELQRIPRSPLHLILLSRTHPAMLSIDVLFPNLTTNAASLASNIRENASSA